MATKVAIIAGFEPFGGLDKNPSGDAVAFLDRFSEGFTARPLVLPVCCGSGWETLRAAVADLPQDVTFAIVLAGLASTRHDIEVERFALNIKDYRIPDNEQHQWTGEEVLAGEPAAIRSAGADAGLLAVLAENGLSCRASNHAGTFVCNEIYYRALHDWQSDPRCTGVVFAHMPPLENYAEKEIGNLSSQDAEDVYRIYRYAEALALIARYLLR